MTRSMRYVVAACMAVASTAAFGQFKNNLMPLPSSVTPGSGALELKTTFLVETPDSHDARLMSAIDRESRQIEMLTGLAHAGTGVTPTVKLIVNVKGPGNAVQSIDEDETYSLKVTSAAAEIDANSDVGAMHGLATLAQLVQSVGDTGYILPAVTIQDAPRFRWRGLMIDCGRHFEPIAVIKRNIDAMAAVKLNVFHWHLTEDQGFRMESKVFPNLTAKGADNGYYSQDDAREIVAYAAARGIRVVPEFEMPGHSTAWIYAYPELNSGTKPESIRRQFGVSPYAIDPTNDETYVFIEKFLTEMAAIFPDAYMHIGGDETPAPDWNTNPKIMAFKQAHNLKDNAALQAYFNTRLLTILTKLHKHMVGWDEIMTPGLPTDVIVQSWRGFKSLAAGAKMGYAGILSAGYYLDGMQTSGQHYLVDPIPADTDLTPEQQKLIIGGETPMWGEHVWSRDIDSRIWPRTAAIAERFWSARENRDVDDMYRRLDAVSIQLEVGGLTLFESTDVGLRDLVGTTQIDDLRTFASYLEPIPFGRRSGIQHTNQLSALDLFVDAVRPDPPSKHWSDVTVRHLLANPSDQNDRAELERFFSRASAVIPEVKREIAVTPRMNEINVVHMEQPMVSEATAAANRRTRPPEPPPARDQLRTRADQLAALAQIGHEALQYFGSGKKAPAGWKAKAQETIKAADTKSPRDIPPALVNFTFLDPLSKLVDAVQE